jgi:hypothetical protein
VARRRKNYRVAPSPIPLISEPGTLVVNFVQADGTLKRSFDFTMFGKVPMAAELALAFRHHLGDKAASTRISTYRRLPCGSRSSRNMMMQSRRCVTSIQRCCARSSHRSIPNPG